MNDVLNALLSLVPPVLVGLVFWVIMRSIVRIDSKERDTYAKIEAEEAHPAQPIPDHELHPRIRQIMLRLNHQHLEHRYRIKGRSATLGTIAIAKPAGQQRPEAFKLYRSCHTTGGSPSLLCRSRCSASQNMLRWCIETLFNAPNES